MPLVNKRAATKRAKRGKPAKQKDDTRFNCPYPGCDRSCAELWRLKVHFRAPPDNKGSGVERGHNAELEYCPRCFQKLEPGKHHVGCRSGLAAPRQALKREGRNQEARDRKERPKRSRSESSVVDSTDVYKPPADPLSEAQGGGPLNVVDEGKPEITALDIGPSASKASPATTVFRFSAVHQRPSAHSFSSLGGAIQLQRSTSLHSETSYLEPLPALQCSPLDVGHGYLDCEIDDEVVIPKSFAPHLSVQQPDFYPLPLHMTHPVELHAGGVLPEMLFPEDSLHASQMRVWSIADAPLQLPGATLDLGGDIGPPRGGF